MKYEFLKKLRHETGTKVSFWSVCWLKLHGNVWFWFFWCWFGKSNEIFRNLRPPVFFTGPWIFWRWWQKAKDNSQKAQVYAIDESRCFVFAILWSDFRHSNGKRNAEDRKCHGGDNCADNCICLCNVRRVYFDRYRFFEQRNMLQNITKLQTDFKRFPARFKPPTEFPEVLQKFQLFLDENVSGFHRVIDNHNYCHLLL